MKLKLIPYMAAAALCLATAGCMDDHDIPDTSNLLVTSPTSIGEVNSTILEVKQKYCASSTGAGFVRNSSNFYTKVTEDLIIEGVVVANDISGNLYQTILLRHIDSSVSADDPAHDQCIILGVKNTALYPYFALGQRVKVNLKGLYAGVYSKVPRIGQPTLSSYGNLNLGPILFELLSTNVELVGSPDTSAPELTPIDRSDADGDAWLRASANKTYQYTPQLAIVRGTIDEVTGSNATVHDVGEITGETESFSANGKKMFAPYELHDNGYGVDRTISLVSNNTNVNLRTSTKIELSYMELPTDTRSYTGILTYYDTWQIQLRTPQDVEGFE